MPLRTKRSPKQERLRSEQDPLPNIMPAVRGDEALVQISIRAPQRVRRQLQMTAVAQGMTIQTYILALLRERGFLVTDDDLRDKRQQT
jgi:hypothetical protein